MENNKSNMGLKIALAIAVALFLGTAFYTMNLSKTSEKVEEDLTAEKQLVMEDLNIMAKQYDAAIGENKVANNDLIEARAKIQELIESLKVSDGNLKSLLGYQRKYMTLKNEMDKLLAENDRLKVQNSNLSSSLDSTRVRLQERTVFTDSLLVQNNALADVVSNASVLGAVNLKGFGVIERTSGKLIPTERASRSDKIRVCFTVPKNRLVQSGDQELYIQVIDPKNTTLGLNDQVSFKGKTIKYSVLSKFNYEKASLDICEFVTMSGKNDFEKGRYIVNVFNEKDLVATSEFTLK